MQIWLSVVCLSASTCRVQYVFARLWHLMFL